MIDEEYTLTVWFGLVTPTSSGWRAWLTIGSETFYAEERTERRAIRVVRRKKRAWARYGPWTERRPWANGHHA